MLSSWKESIYSCSSLIKIIVMMLILTRMRMMRTVKRIIIFLCRIIRKLIKLITHFPHLPWIPSSRIQICFKFQTTIQHQNLKILRARKVNKKIKKLITLKKRNNKALPIKVVWKIRAIKSLQIPKARNNSKVLAIIKITIAINWKKIKWFLLKKINMTKNLKKNSKNSKRRFNQKKNAVLREHTVISK